MVETSNFDGQSTVAIAEKPRPTQYRASRSLDVYLIGFLAFLVSAAWSNRIYFWSDEGATIAASNRTLPELWKLLGNYDTHQGLYYLMMHFWFEMFPPDEFTSRLPSSVAVGVAAAGVVVLGKQLSTRTVALTAGVVFAVLPRVTWAGIDARSFALTMAASVWLTIYCVFASRRGIPRGWALYGVLLVVAVLLNIYLLLLIPAHAVVVRTVAGSSSALRYWAIAVAVACAVIAPFLMVSQSRFPKLPPLSFHNVNGFLVYPFFVTHRPSTNVAIVAGVILLVGLALGFRNGFGRSSRLLAVTVTWILVPAIVLLVVPLFSHVAYRPRHLSFTAPAFALLLGLCMATVAGRLPGKWSRAGIVALLTVFVLAATPTYFAQRKPYGKESMMDYSPVAEVIDRNAAPGDCLLLEDIRIPNKFWKPSNLLLFRPNAYEKLIDNGLSARAEETGSLYESRIPVSEWKSELNDCEVLWTLSMQDSKLPKYETGTQLDPGPRLAQTDTFQVPNQLGFRIVERWRFVTTQVTKSTRQQVGSVAPQK
jgi:mannosyltransferase